MKIRYNDTEFRKFRAKMLNFPQAIKPAIAKTLNKQAASMKFEFIPETLESEFVIRDPRFMHRQLRYNTTSQKAKIDNMFSEAGSVEIRKSSSKGAFTGWEEQQTGKSSEVNRVATTAARVGNSFSGRMRPKDRMKKQNISRFVTPKDFLSSEKVHSRSQAMFFMLRESKASRRPFIIPRGFRRIGKTKNMKAGLYGWIGKRLMRFQRFDKKYRPQATDWMGKSIERLTKKQGGFRKVFSNELDKVIAEFNKEIR